MATVGHHWIRPRNDFFATNFLLDPEVLDLLSPQLVADRRWLLALRPQSLQYLTLEDPESWVRNHSKELVGETDPLLKS